MGVVSSHLGASPVELSCGSRLFIFLVHLGVCFALATGCLKKYWGRIDCQHFALGPDNRQTVIVPSLRSRGGGMVGTH